MINKKENKIVEEMRQFVDKVDEGLIIKGELEEYLKKWLDENGTTRSL